MAPLDPWRYDLRALMNGLRKLTAVHIIRPSTVQSHMPPPVVVPFGELSTETAQVVKVSNQWHSEEPLLFEGPIHALCHSNATMLADGTQAELDVPVLQKLLERTANEHAFMVRNKMPWGAKCSERLFERTTDPACIGSFERDDANDLA